jgi:hypothetical protein
LHSAAQCSTVMSENITISVGKHTWICAICGQGFTRKTTGVRHSKNLHAGNPILVRPYEYIVGRLRGTYKQSDPLFFRRKKGEGTTSKLSSVNDPRLANPIKFQNNILHETQGSQQKGNQHVDNYGVVPSLRLSEQISDRMPASGSAEPMKETMSRSEKLKEIIKLAQMHYSPDNARCIIMAAYVQGGVFRDNSSLSQTLEYLRNIAKA